MHSFISFRVFYAVVSLVAVNAALVRRAEPYSTWMADSAIARGQGNGLDSSGKPQVSYEHGTFQHALEILYNATGNAKYLNYIQTGIDHVVSSSGTVGGGYKLSDYTLDDLRIGPSFIFLYEKTKQNKYKIAADSYRKQFYTHPRTSEGGFWHKQKYPQEQWLDGIYICFLHCMLEDSHTRACANDQAKHYVSYYEPQNQTAFADIMNQFGLMEKHVIQNSTGLLFHGYDNSKKAVWADPVTGASPEVWDRAVGWYVMALVDVLDFSTWSTTQRNTLIGYLRTHAQGLVKAMDADSDLWWLVISEPGRARNYFESSGAAMFVYAILKGIRKGFLDEATFLAPVQRAYEAIVKTFVVQESDGTLGWLGTVQVGSLDGNGTFDYYVSVPTDKNDLKGVAPFVMASWEYEQT